MADLINGNIIAKCYVINKGDKMTSNVLAVNKIYSVLNNTFNTSLHISCFVYESVLSFENKSYVTFFRYFLEINAMFLYVT